jgi:DNA-binding response OmpR family regulator
MQRILIVEDDDATRTLLKERLRDTYDIVATGDPAQALAMTLDLCPKCILLDLLMPGLTGFEMCKTLSNLSLTKNTPILVLSGNPAAQYGSFCSHLGARDYFQKPIDFDRLRTRLSELIEQELPDRRPELRLKLQVMVELRGLDRYGKAFQEFASTEDVSANGFCCAVALRLDRKSIVEVFLRSGDIKRRVGRAQVVYTLWRGTRDPQYGFQFTQKPSEWLL